MLVTFVLALALAAAGPETPSPAPALVSFDTLRRSLDDPNLRLLDARPIAAYEAGHMPGAVHVDPKAVEALAKPPGALKDRSIWSRWVASLGLRPGMRVLLYDDNRQLDAARAWWLLTYCGVPNVGLVDGNFGPWKDAGHPVSTQVVFVTPVAFEVRFRDDLNAPRDLVLGAITSGTDQVLDARSIEEHDGRKALSKRAGHVPTACHLEWVNMVDAQGRFRPIEELQAMVKAAGIVDGRPVISHCQGGGRASVNAFVLMRLGFSTRNYYPGWSDWGNAEDTPVEDGRKPTRP